MSPIFIETSRLILRQWQQSDLEPYVQLNRNEDVMAFFPSILNREECVAQIERVTNHINEFGYGIFAVERKDNQQFIGFTGLSHPRFEADFTPCVEIGWRLSKANWGMGFATEAAIACLEFGFNIPAINEIYSFTSVHNKRSEHVMIKIGMEKTGIFEHPSLPEGHILREHVLYKIVK